MFIHRSLTETYLTPTNNNSKQEIPTEKKAKCKKQKNKHKKHKQTNINVKQTNINSSLSIF